MPLFERVLQFSKAVGLTRLRMMNSSKVTQGHGLDFPVNDPKSKAPPVLAFLPNRSDLNQKMICSRS